MLISGLSFVGYLTAKLVGTARSIGLGGLLGGLVSSTAVTLAYSRRSHTHPVLELLLAVGVLLASAVLASRILVLLGIVAPNLVVPALPPLAALFALTFFKAELALGLGTHRFGRAVVLPLLLAALAAIVVAWAVMP